MKDHIKVFFVREIAENVFETESLWCIRTGEYFIVDNIPFVAKRVSLGDTINAKYDHDDKVFYFDAFIAVSGNTTARLYFDDEALMNVNREKIVQLGCETEVFRSRKIIAVNIPRDIDYKPVKAFFESGEQMATWTYEESCLAHEID